MMPLRGNQKINRVPDRIRNALPIVPFAFRNQRVQSFADFLLTEFDNELFKLVLNSPVMGA